MKLNKIVFVQRSLGHYHYPRMKALAAECQKAGIHFVNIELAGNQKINRWIVENKQAEFNNVTLFPEEDQENIPLNALWPALKNKLVDLNPDVIFIIGYDIEIMRRVKVWAGWKRIATVLVSDSNEFDKKRYRILEFIKYLFVSRFDAAFTGGTGSSAYIQKLGIPKERIVEGCDVIDTSLFSRQAYENQKKKSEIRQKWSLPEKYFLFVGRIVEQKNLFLLADAYKIYLGRLDVETTPWNLVICGNGPKEEELQTHIENFSAHIRKNILLYGYIKQPDIIDFFSSASCFVLPSFSETWGLVVNEALACGLPLIVSSKAGSSLDLVKDRGNGWVFNPYNVNELAELMINMTRLDDSKRIQMGLRGKTLIAEWGLEKFVQGAIKCARLAMSHQEDRKNKFLLSSDRKLR